MSHIPVETLIFWIAQGVGLIALGFSLYAYQSKTKDQILGRQMAGAFVYMFHFSLLSAWTGVAVNALVALRNWIFGKKETHAWAKHDWWMWFFMALAVATLFFTWQGPISLLPVAGVLTGIYGRWHGDAKKIRFYTLIGSVLWIPYNYTVQSYTGVAVEIFVIGSVLWGMWKHDRHPPVAPV